MTKKQLAVWEKVVNEGFGNKFNMCAWSMKKYKEYLYVGTLNFVNGCQIYRSKSGDKFTWKQVNLDGFHKKSPSSGARTMIVYNNLLWIVTLSSEYGTQVWVTNGEEESNGLIKWKKANLDGFGEGSNIHGSRALVIYKDKLYIGTQCKKGLPKIYRYDGLTEFNNLQPSKWIWINKEWHNNIQNNPDFSVIGELVHFKPYNGKQYIYASIYSEVVPLINQLKKCFKFRNLLKILFFFFSRSCKIWRYDGKNWEEISKKGFGKPNIMAMSSLVFNGSIYFGTSNIFGAEVWKSTDGINWIRVMKRGFGVPMNISIWRLHTFENRLILGVQNQWLGCQIWASNNNHPDNNKNYIQIAQTGMTKKIQINPINIKQDGIRTFETFNNHLYAGTASDMNIIFYNKIGPGCEIWRTKNI